MSSNNLQDDPKDLMRLAKDGDTDAFERLYEIYFVPVFRYIYFRVKNKEETEDLVQEVFLKVYNSISKFQEKGRSPLAFFFVVARNTVIDYWRKKKEIKLDKPEDILKISDTKESPWGLIRRSETISIINEAIRYLPSGQQEVIILKFINDLSNQEIALLLKKSEVAIRQLQSRALKNLRKQLKELRSL